MHSLPHNIWSQGSMIPSRLFFFFNFFAGFILLKKSCLSILYLKRYMQEVSKIYVDLFTLGHLFVT